MGSQCSPSAEVGVVVLGNLLVGLLGSGVGSTLDGVGDVVSGVADLVHDDGWGLCLVCLVGIGLYMEEVGLVVNRLVDA